MMVTLNRLKTLPMSKTRKKPFEPIPVFPEELKSEYTRINKTKTSKQIHIDQILAKHKSDTMFTKKSKKPQNQSKQKGRDNSTSLCGTSW